MKIVWFLVPFDYYYYFDGEGRKGKALEMKMILPVSIRHVVHALIGRDAYISPTAMYVRVWQSQKTKKWMDEARVSPRVHTAINLRVYCLFAAVKNDFKKLVVAVFVIVGVARCNQNSSLLWIKYILCLQAWKSMHPKLDKEWKI